MKKIHNKAGVNFRPQLGEPLLKLSRRVMKKANTGNLSPIWNETDAARFLMAKGWEVVSKEPIPADVKGLLKPFDRS